MERGFMNYILLIAIITPLSIYSQPKLGIDVINKHEVLNHLVNKRVGIITNHTGINSSGHRSIDILLEQRVNLTAIFCPEHGFDGTIAASAEVHHTIDEKTGIPVVSLYKTATKRIPQDWLDQLDCLLFDIQDSGMRHYTYISTLMYAMQSAAKAGISFVILDRPNPLTGRMEGPLVEPELISFISIAPIPLRHGLTIGELALYFNSHVLNNVVSLYVVPMQQYKRHKQPNYLSKSLSPNITNLQSCFGYSFFGVLGEVKPFELGIGSPKAFKCILLPESLQFPKKHWFELDHMLQKHGIKSTWYEYYHQKKKLQFYGLELFIKNINEVRSFTVLLDILKFFKNKGITLTCSPEFDKAVGTPKIRQWMHGELPFIHLTEYINTNITEFRKKISPLLLYESQLKWQKL